VAKSSVGRGFVRASAAGVEKLAERRFESELRRVKGHRDMPALLKAPETVAGGDRVVSGVPLSENARRHQTSALRTERTRCKRERF
jgi:hypothetical protein